MDGRRAGVDVTGCYKAGVFPMGLGGLLKYLYRRCFRVFR